MSKKSVFASLSLPSCKFHSTTVMTINSIILFLEEFEYPNITILSHTDKFLLQMGLPIFRK